MNALQQFRGKLGLAAEQATNNPIMAVVGLGLTAYGAYHGYKRNCGSIGWAIGWGLLTPMFFPIMVPVSIAQGVGKPYKCG